MENNQGDIPRRFRQPVKPGDSVKAGIIGWGDRGNPFVKVKGFVIYIENFEGKSLRIGVLIPLKITRVYDKFAFAEIEDA